MPTINLHVSRDDVFVLRAQILRPFLEPVLLLQPAGLFILLLLILLHHLILHTSVCRTRTAAAAAAVAARYRQQQQHHRAAWFPHAIPLGPPSTSPVAYRQDSCNLFPAAAAAACQPQPLCSTTRCKPTATP